MTRARDLADFNLDGKAVTINESSADLDFRVEGNGNANAFFVQGSDDFIGIGTGTPKKKLHIQDTTSDGIIILDMNGTTTDHQICFAKNYQSGGQSGGNYYAIGVDGSENKLVFAFDANAQASLSADAKVTLDSGGDLTINDGDLVIGTSGHGIDFSATSDASGATSELLDDYEEGTWTPVLTTSSGTPATYGAQQIGKYVKIGDLVHIYFDIAINQINNSNTTLVSGHPFNSVNNDALAVSFFSTLAVSPVFVSFQCVGSQGFMAVGLTSAGTNISNGMGIFGNSTRIIASGTYRTA